jgi:hypothetical protein
MNAGEDIVKGHLQSFLEYFLGRHESNIIAGDLDEITRNFYSEYVKGLIEPTDLDRMEEKQYYNTKALNAPSWMFEEKMLKIPKCILDEYALYRRNESEHPLDDILAMARHFYDGSTLSFTLLWMTDSKCRFFQMHDKYMEFLQVGEEAWILLPKEVRAFGKGGCPKGFEWTLSTHP